MSYLPAIEYVRRSWQPGKTEYCYVCPNCGKDNLWWNLEKGRGQCFSCSEGYNEFTFRRLWGEDSGRQIGVANLLRELAGAAPPRRKNCDEPILRKLRPPAFVLKFLVGERGCDESDLESVGVEYDEQTDRVFFPIHFCRLWDSSCHSSSLRPRAYVSRKAQTGAGDWRYEAPKHSEEAEDESQPNSKAEHWFSPGFSEAPARLVLVEGVFDVLRPRLVGKAIALLGTTLSEHHEYALRNVEQVFIWMDPDSTGRKAARRIARQVNNPVVVNHRYEPGDVTPMEAMKVLEAHGW